MQGVVGLHSTVSVACREKCLELTKSSSKINLVIDTEI